MYSPKSLEMSEPISIGSSHDEQRPVHLAFSGMHFLPLDMHDHVVHLSVVLYVYENNRD